MNKKIICLLLSCCLYSCLSTNSPSFATPTDLYLSAGNSGYYKIKDDLSAYEKIDLDTYEAHLPQSDTAIWSDPVIGFDEVKVNYEQKDRDIFVKGVKVLTLPKDSPDANDWGPHYTVSAIYEIKPSSGRTFYSILTNDGMTKPNSYGETNDLVEVKDNKVIHHIKVYQFLRYVSDDTWRSTACYSGAGLYVLTQHSISGKYKDMDMRGAALAYASKNGHTFKWSEDDVVHIGDMGTSAFFSIQSRDKLGRELPLKRIYEVFRDGKVSMREEQSRSLSVDRNIFIHNYRIYALEQDEQVLRRLNDRRSLYFGGSATNLGTFKKLKETAFKAQLPVYEYKNSKYICLEDLTLLGYTMKWDAKAKVGHWTYTGKKTGKAHVFKKTTIYDNDVFATLNEEYLHLYNCEGYSLVKLSDIDWRVKN